MKCIGQNASDQVIPHFRSPWAQCLMCLMDNSALERANTCLQFNVYYLGRYIICWLKTKLLLEQKITTCVIWIPHTQSSSSSVQNSCPLVCRSVKNQEIEHFNNAGQFYIIIIQSIYTARRTSRKDCFIVDQFPKKFYVYQLFHILTRILTEWWCSIYIDLQFVFIIT